MCQTWDRYRKRGLILVIQAAGNSPVPTIPTRCFYVSNPLTRPSIAACVCFAGISLSSHPRSAFTGTSLSVTSTNPFIGVLTIPAFASK